MAKTRITVRQIEAFVSVAESNSFTAAAARLELTTSAISSLIAELESTVGARLFERSTRKVVLNDAGRLFLPSAISFYRTQRSLERVAEGLSTQSSKTVRIAAPMVVASAILPRLIAEFYEQYSETEIVIVETGVEWLGERVAMGEADLAVGPDRATDDNVLAEELMPSKWVAWLSPQHPLASKPILKWRDLAGIEFQTGGYDHERIIEQAAASLPAEESLVPGQVFDNISTALGFAAANLGVTLCPAYVAPMAQAFDLEMRRLIDPEFTRYVMLYSSAIRPRTEVVAAFARHLAQRFEAVAETSNSRSSHVAAQ